VGQTVKQVSPLKRGDKGVCNTPPTPLDRGEAGVDLKPVLKELDRLRLERLNLSIGNLNLQLALLNERARALQIETAGFKAEREGLVKALHHEDAGLDGKWRLNPDTMIFEAVQQAGVAPVQTKKEDN